MTHSLKVSSRSVPHSVAGALAGILRERDGCDMQVIGAGALNQAVKAIAIARTYLVDDEIDIVCIPEFSEVQIDGQTRTAIRLTVERRVESRVDLDLSIAAHHPDSASSTAEAAASTYDGDLSVQHHATPSLINSPTVRQIGGDDI
ncbi:MAG: stage V sporulation protein S [Actinobacteria bacterium ATB1]|nr:stage V sporulation protein S [Actinobacteria bacterium ATB1]